MQRIKFRFENLEDMAQGGAPPQSRRFKINLKSLCNSGKNKLSSRFQEVDRLFVCRKTKEQRVNMGIEYDDIKLTEVYCKANSNKVAQRYGKAYTVSLGVTHDGEPSVKRIVAKNPDWVPPPAIEQEEDRLLDEQKLF